MILVLLCFSRTSLMTCSSLLFFFFNDTATTEIYTYTLFPYTTLFRSAADMKGGLVVLLYLLKALEQSPLAEKIGWEVLINPRSEEHTSELQSLMRISYAVFCLKKKKQ